MATPPPTADTGPNATLPDQGASRPLVVGFAADVAAVVVFAVAGRHTHDEGGGIGGVVTTAAPFLIAVGTSWLAVAVISARLGRSPRRLLLQPESGVNIAISTTTLGMLLRRTIWGDGTAVVFVVVTAMFLIAAFAGWRALAALRRR